MSGPNGEFGRPIVITDTPPGLRWPLRLRLDAAGVRLVCGWAACEGAVLELNAREAEDWPIE